MYQCVEVVRTGKYKSPSGSLGQPSNESTKDENRIECHKPT
jgi:hypothetical protein